MWLKTMRAGLALGSNLGDRLVALEAARARVLKIAGVSGPILSSSIYETDPVDSSPSAGPFLNAVIEVEFGGDPAFFLRSLQAIELEMGRPAQRAVNAPRTIDLDILYLGNLVFSTPELVIPHPRLHLRRFVLEPLTEINPALHLPGHHASTSALLASLQDPAGVHRAAQQWKRL